LLKTWIWPCEPESWPTVKEKKVWAVGKKGKGSRVEKGDQIIFYINKSRYFQGIFEVISEWHEPQIKWPSEESVGESAAAEIDLKEIKLGFASLRDLLNKLEFIERKKHVGLYLRGTPHGPGNSAKPISPEDYKLIFDELERVQEKPFEEESNESIDIQEFAPVSTWDFVNERIHELPPPNLKTIDYIISDVNNGKFAIPIFQREYTWKRKQIEELWESIFQGFFVGSILTWNSNDQFETIPVHGAPALNNPSDIVLDGQQRITSLYYAVMAPDVKLPDNRIMRFFVDLRALLDPKASSTDIVFSELTDRARRRGWLEKEKQFEKKIFPLSEFNNRNYTLWVNDFKNYLKDVEELSAEDSDNYYRQILRIFDNVWFQYKIPVVQLPRSLSLDSVAEVFEKINSKGTRLGVFDLLNARFTKYGINLRILWDKAKSDYRSIETLYNELDDAEKIILQGICLFKKGYTRRKEVLSLDSSYTELKLFQKESFLKDWEKVCKFTSKAVEKLQSQRETGFGAVKFKIIPYTITIPILAALMLRSEGRDDEPKCKTKIENWYWATVISDSYSGSTDSKIEKDFREMIQWFDDDNEIPEIVLEQRKIFDEITFNSTRSNDSVYRTIMCIISKNGAYDFVTDEPPEYSQLDDHHIFPKSKEKDYSSNTSINSILNRTLISTDTNRNYIRDKKPFEYIDKIINSQQITESTIRRRLESHLISNEAYDCLIRDDFDGFVESRRNTIREKIRKLIFSNEESQENTIEGLLHTNESQRLEYKSSMRWDMRQNQRNDALEEVIAKELCCFMNSSGGDLLIGVDDNGVPIGLEKDYSTFSDGNSDSFGQHITNLINKYLDRNANAYVELEFSKIDNNEICRCKVRSSPRPIYFSKNNEKKFFVRANNTCQPRNMEEAHSYISEHWR
jgi:predicted RNA-binding protein